LHRLIYFAIKITEYQIYIFNRIHYQLFAAAIRTEECQATMIDDESMSIILREPIGVVAQIIPWNFGFLMACWEIASAIYKQAKFVPIKKPPSKCGGFQIVLLLFKNCSVMEQQ